MYVFKDNKDEYKMIIINGKETNYAIYKTGKIRNMKSGKVLSTHISTNGRRMVTLTINNKSCHRTVYRLLAEAFIPNPDNLPQIDHINGNKLDDRLENLEWVTGEENLRRAKEMGLLSYKGDDSPVAVLSNTKVEDICSKLEEGYTVKELAEEYGVGRTTISDIKNGKIWTHISEKYNIKRQPKSNLAEEDVIQIWYKIQDGEPLKKIANEFNVSTGVVHRIMTKERWSRVTNGL